MAKIYDVANGGKVFNKPRRMNERVSFIISIANSDELIEKMEVKGYKLIDVSYSQNGYNKIIEFEKEYNIDEWV
jgi:hypothetical protein